MMDPRATLMGARCDTLPHHHSALMEANPMAWIAWRQFRTAAWLAVAALGLVTVLLAITGHNVANQWTSSGAAICQNQCGMAIHRFIGEANAGMNGGLYRATAVLMYVLPVLIGMCWGAPLIARELESGTHSLAWNQSITRTRWLTTKLAVIGTASAVTTGLLTWAVTSWAHHLDHARFYRITPLMYGARGIVPIGYALFAFALGVTLGMLIRRTVPAMAATLVVYVAAVAAMPLWIRADLAPVSHVTPPLDVTSIANLTISAPTSMQVVGGATPDNAWVLSNKTITATGQLFSWPPNPQACSDFRSIDNCTNWLGTLGLRQDITYQPAGHFWPLQWAETGLFVALAIALGGFCLWWTRRRLT